MAKKDVNTFFSPIEIARNLMIEQQAKISKQVVGQERQKRRTMLGEQPIDDIITQIVQEDANGTATLPL
jgi:hypothetical protein